MAYWIGQTSIDLGDTRRHVLPLPFFHVELERLEQRVPRIFPQILLADRQSRGKISIHQVLARLLVGTLDQIVLGADLVIKILVRDAPIGRGRIRNAPVQLNQPLELGQR